MDEDHALFAGLIVLALFLILLVVVSCFWDAPVSRRRRAKRHRKDTKTD